MVRHSRPVRPSCIALKIGHQNIHGNGKVKLEHQDLIDKIQDHHIYGCQETWLSKEDQCPDINGYSLFRSERKKHVRAFRNSGGSVIYVKRSILGGITKISSKSNKYGDVIWLRLDKNFFGLDNNILLCYAYIVPTADQEAFSSIQQDIENNSNKGAITILGDVNSRIGRRLIEHFDVTVQDGVALTKSLHVPSRLSQDATINGNGRKLLKIASDFNLIPANGTVLGDLEGKYTCAAWNGSSCNDLLLFHRSLYQRINYFKVNEDFDWYSDHRSLSFSIRVRLSIGNRNRSRDTWGYIKKHKLIWNEESINTFNSILSNEEYKGKLLDYSQTTFSSSNEAAESLNKIIAAALRETFPSDPKQKNTKKCINTPKSRENFSWNVQNAKRSFKLAQRQFKANNDDLSRRQTFFREKRKYKQAIYLAKKLSKERRINRIAGLESSDPKTFWKELKSLINPKDDATMLIEKEEWSKHFHDLLNVPNAPDQDLQFLEYVRGSLPTLERESDIGENNHSLNSEFSSSEVQESVKSLKMGKSCYIDNIGNEVIKHGYSNMEPALIALFNVVLRYGSFPKIWSDGLIIPLHKKDDKLDPNNYRGIVISSCLGKLFLKILTKRINKYMETTGKWSTYQCGFKQDHRTEDNLFLLNTIYEKYVKRQKKKVYMAFIDFSKFFDKINRYLLRYKLLKVGITGNIYHLIKSVYEDTTYQVRIGDRLSPTFKALNGVKQGCCMSPVLSNIFQNDLHDIFDEQCDPLTLSSVLVNSISWADDLIMASTSKTGLQECLNRLSSYCQKWGLEVNILKTKIMIFSNKFDPILQFTFNNSPIEQVKSFKYLGFELSHKGTLTSIITDRIENGKKVANMVLHALRAHKNVSTSLAMSIFEKQIAPVLLYGCPIWSVPNDGNLIYLENQPEHVNTRQIVQNALTTVSNKPVNFIYARRVGKIRNGHSRDILIKLLTFKDKENILGTHNGTFKFRRYKSEDYSDITKAQLDFCKKSLNLSKYASSCAVRLELGIHTMDAKAHSLAIKYWLRLETGTSNFLLNQAYNESKFMNTQWLQGIQYLLTNNGFGDVLAQPHSVHPTLFHKTFRERLDDQSSQELNNKISASSRFDVLYNLVTGQKFATRKYITLIKNPNIREIFTRLRTDVNILENSKTRVNKSNSGGKCNLCDRAELETPEHFLFECSYFSQKREQYFTKLNNIDEHFKPADMGNTGLLKYFLDLCCPPACVHICCNYVSNLYKARQEISQEN